jgi:hypothetical protein
MLNTFNYTTPTHLYNPAFGATTSNQPLYAGTLSFAASTTTVPFAQLAEAVYLQ